MIEIRELRPGLASRGCAAHRGRACQRGPKTARRCVQTPYPEGLPSTADPDAADDAHIGALGAAVRPVWPNGQGQAWEKPASAANGPWVSRAAVPPFRR